MKRVVLYSLVAYCFLFGILSRELGSFPYGILIEGIIIVEFVFVIIKTSKKQWQTANNELFYLLLFWFVISVLEVINPGASTMGWLVEIRSTALYPLLIVSLGFLVLENNRDLDLFILIVVSLSFLASLNGIKQLSIGLSPGEQQFLDEGGAVTHLLWGRLRVFSFYSDAGQFGASQAHIGLMALIMSFGPFRRWKRVAFFIGGVIMIYGMLISGTRGALFAIIVGSFTAIILSKKFKVLVLGGAFALSMLFILKYTHIGDGNYQIYRLRSALNPNDPSLNLRLINQKMLASYMSSRPFGGGLGVIGANGTRYNQDKLLSKVQPDSYYVKVWAMYGIVGFTIWLCIMLFIFGKCCGIVWNIQNPALKNKLIALTAGYAGILFCSYGNEVINTMPSSIVVYLSWVFIYLGPKLENAKESRLLN
jgi:O-antigen ligase